MALAVALALLAAPAAGAAPRQDGADVTAAAGARISGWLGDLWRVVFGAGSSEDDRGPEIDPNGLVPPPGGGGAKGGTSAGSGGGTAAQCSGDCGPGIDPDG